MAETMADRWLKEGPQIGRLAECDYGTGRDIPAQKGPTCHACPRRRGTRTCNCPCHGDTSRVG